MGEFAIGQGVPRFEDPRLVRGGGRYIDDVVLPGMAFGVVLRSPHGHAKIHVDQDRRRQGRARCPYRHHRRRLEKSGPRRIARHMPDSSAVTARRCSRPRYPVLAEDRVRWVGDPVAFVVAETTAQAHDAAELIEVDYEPLPAVVSTAEATEPGAARSGTTARTISASWNCSATRPRPMRPSPRPRMSSSTVS